MTQETNEDDILTEEPHTEETHLIRNERNAELDFRKNPKYPSSVYFVLAFEFMERFSHYIIQTILVVYMSIALNYSDDTSTAIYHIYFIIAYLFPVIGSILAENWLGNFKTVMYFSVVYVISCVIITLGSAANVLNIDIRWTTFIGLILNAMCNGLIKPSVSTFGGEQFVLPQQQPQLDRFFSHFVFVINVASLIAMFIAPIMRHNFSCLGMDGCYPLPFTVATVAMAIALVVLVLGYKTYVFRNPSGNVLVHTARCIGHALCVRKCGPRDHWLDHADDEYDVDLIADVKATLRVLVIFLPLPFYWALFQQLGSRWILQAALMDLSLGFYTIDPEQTQMVNCVFMLVLIPLFDYCVYPLLAKCYLIRRPLQKLGVGMTIGALAFITSGFLELKLQQTYAVLPEINEAQLRLYNAVNCTFHVHVQNATENNATSGDLGALDMLTFLHVPMYVQELNLSIILTPTSACDNPAWSGNITVARQEATSYLITSNKPAGLTANRCPPYDKLEKPPDAKSKIRFIYDFPDNVTRTVVLTERRDSRKNEVILSGSTHGSQYSTLPPGSYDVACDNVSLAEVTLEAGAVYSILIGQHSTSRAPTARLFTLTTPNSVSIYWQLPQQVLLTISEVMVSVTGISFSFSQAPVRMKSVLTAAWLITVSYGNVIVVIDAEGRIFKNQAYEYFLFAGLMLVNVIGFIVLAVRYKYVDDVNKIDANNSLRTTYQDDLAVVG